MYNFEDLHDRNTIPMPYMRTWGVEDVYDALKARKYEKPAMGKGAFMSEAKSKARRKNGTLCYNEEDIYALCVKAFPKTMERFYSYLGKFQEAFT